MSTWLAGVSPTEALCVFSVGLLLIYVELNRPRRVVPGALGLLLILLACARFWVANPRPVALLLVGTAVILMAIGLVRGIHVAVELAATLALVLGFRELVIPPAGWVVSVLCGVVLVGTTATLTRVARRARANKASGQNA